MTEFDTDTETTFSSTDPDDALMRDLNEWFVRQDSLDGTVELHIRPPEDGELGGMADAVAVSAAAISVAKSFFAWLELRVRSQKVSMVLKDKFTGRELELNLDRGQDTGAVLPQLLKFYAPPGQSTDD